jgi:peroxin-11B
MEVVISLGRYPEEIKISNKDSKTSLVSIELIIAISRDSRKIFSLFKSIHEVKTINEKIKDLLWQEKKLPVVLDILSRLGFLFYYLFDNISILSSIKFIHTDAKFVNKLASFGWAIGLVFALIKDFIGLFKIIQTQKTEKKDYEVEIFNKLLEIIMKLSDLLVALNGLDVPLMLTGKSLNDGVQGGAGLVSAVIGIYNSFK